MLVCAALCYMKGKFSIASSVSPSELRIRNRIIPRSLERRRILTCGTALAAFRHRFSNPVCPELGARFHVLPDKTGLRALNSFSEK